LRHPLEVEQNRRIFWAALEMMACGGVCVVGRVSGYDEYINDGENALVVEPTDIDAARSAVQRLITDQELRGKLQKNGLETAAQRDWESSIDKLENCFEDITEGKQVYFGPTREQTNRSLIYCYEKMTSNSPSQLGLEALARTIEKRVRSQFLLRLGEKIYLRILNHRRFYARRYLSRLFGKNRQ